MLSTAPVLAFNHLLAAAPWARERLAAFAGRRAQISLPPVSFILEVTGEGYFAAGEGEAEVVFSLPAATPLLALKGMEALVKEAHVSGPADFADTLGFVLKNLKWDAEEDLSKLVGDIAAHRLAGLGRRFLGWQRHVLASASENIGEYLREEQGLLPRAADLDAFAGELRQLNEDLARLDGRIGRLDRGAPRPQ